MLSTWAWHLNGNGIVDGRIECICKGRLKIAEGTHVPQKGRCVSGMELTRRRHAVIDFVVDLNLSMPYQAPGTTERLNSLEEEQELICNLEILKCWSGFHAIFVQVPWQSEVWQILK
jgi:hypothetical protein